MYQLKIKAKHLAAEAKIIRTEELKTKEKIKKLKSLGKYDLASNQHSKLLDLQDHRRDVVRLEARATHLARAYIKGMPRAKVEKNPPELHRWELRNLQKRVEAMVNSYGRSVLDEDARSTKSIHEWLTE